MPCLDKLGIYPGFPSSVQGIPNSYMYVFTIILCPNPLPIVLNLSYDSLWQPSTVEGGGRGGGGGTCNSSRLPHPLSWTPFHNSLILPTYGSQDPETAEMIRKLDTKKNVAVKGMHKNFMHVYLYMILLAGPIQFFFAAHTRDMGILSFRAYVERESWVGPGDEAKQT